MNRQELIRNLLQDLGEDPDREGLVRTPDRVDRSLSDLTAGYDQTVESVVGQDGEEVGETLPGLGSHPAGDQLAGRRVERCLTREQHERVADDPMAVRADGPGGRTRQRLAHGASVG